MSEEKDLIISLCIMNWIIHNSLAESAFLQVKLEKWSLLPPCVKYELKQQLIHFTIAENKGNKMQIQFID